jgi:hypothetical protein
VKKLRINSDDVPLPVRAYLSAIPEDVFPRIIQQLAMGQGGGMEDAFCEFEVGGVSNSTQIRFALFEEEVVVSPAELIRYVRVASAAQIASRPDQALAINEAILELVDRFKDDLRATC